MSLDLIKTALINAEAQALARRMSLDAWSEEQSIMGEKVQLFRDYALGEHRADMTPEMARMLRISAPANNTTLSRTLRSQTSRFNDNYMDIVIQTMTDRLKVNAIEADNDAANDWIAALLEANRFDGLQTDAHEAAIRDGMTYMMASWDKVEKRVKFTHEAAWDGASGMLAVFAPDNTIQIAIKVWQETRQSIGDTTRINIYYADRIEKWVSLNNSSLLRYEVEGESWPVYTRVRGEPVGVCVVPFRNRGTTYSPYGVSEIEDAIPLQDALNRTLYSMVMVAELIGFGVRYAVGWQPPAGVMPGEWIAIKANAPLAPDEKIDIGMLQQGDIMPYIEQARWLTSEIGKITRTPAPEFMGSDTASGESLKQRESGLIGKVQRFQVKAGNAWENLIRLAARTQAAFSSAPPEFSTLSARWDEVEVRNDLDVIAQAQILDKMGYHEEALRVMAPIFEWDEKKVQELLQTRRDNEARTFQNQAGNPNIPNFRTGFTGVRIQNGNQQLEETS